MSTSDHSARSSRFSRRSLLAAAGAGAFGIAAGGFGLAAPANAATVKGIEIGGYLTYYHNLDTNARSTNPYTFQYDSVFYARLETWINFWYLNAPAHFWSPLELWLNGTYVDKPGMHGESRAMDISRIQYRHSTTNAMTTGFNGDYNRWRNEPTAAMTKTRKEYWGTIASLNYHFRHVLHYYEADHQNHTHVDNQISGSANSNFATSSTTQCRYVQACLTYVWGIPTSIDGGWGPQTDGNSRTVLARIGRSGGLTTSQANWLEFNRTSTRFGLGKQIY